MATNPPPEDDRAAAGEQPDPSAAPPARPDAVLPAGESGPTRAHDPDAGVTGGGGPLADLDLSSLLGAAAEMQQQLTDAQHEAEETEVEGMAGGGAVRIRVTGAGEFRSVEIAPSAVDPSDVEMLQDLVLAALHDAMRQVQELQAESIGGGVAGLGDLLGGAGLGDLFGGGPDEAGPGDGGPGTSGPGDPR